MTDHTHGGARSGAGRKKGSGRFGTDEAQVQIRVPACDKPAVINFIERRLAARLASMLTPQELAQRYPGVIFLPDPQAQTTEVPVFACRVRAGLPSPADDQIEDMVDLNRLLLDDARERFMVRVKGDSMIEAGIAEGDLLVVDRKREAKHGDIVLAAIDAEPTVKRLFRRNGRLALLPENAGYAPIELSEGQELLIWGVVTSCVKQF
ncbi:LexA family protein [Craterilacuibacter sp.]|uniref:LexA family protein n=1 Tax=Craterilacuibacter sp. TaxID=2870909 RepID=UPI003F374873